MAFDTPTGLPWGKVNLWTGEGKNEEGAKETNLASVGTLQVEFRYLSKVTGRKEFGEAADRAFDQIRSLHPKDGLYPIEIVNVKKQPAFSSLRNTLSFGGRGDSFYEYMLKLWLQNDKKDSEFREMYDESIEGMHDKLLEYSSPSRLAYLSKTSLSINRRGGGKRALTHNNFEHLECFLGGLLALGAHTDPKGVHSSRARRDLKTAKALTYTCYQMYASTRTGLSPEAIDHLTSRQLHLRGQKRDLEKAHEFQPKQKSSYYLLRPEAVESFYILNKLTGDPIYREWGWEVFQSIEKYCKTKYGYGSLKDVTDSRQPPEDSMESFFLAETLKYLYLLMDPDSEVDFMEKHVFNTEAHPLRKFSLLK